MVSMSIVAAQLGHADTRMTEKHYGPSRTSYVAQTIRANFPRLGFDPLLFPFARLVPQGEANRFQKVLSACWK
jgi:hypothetical protein